MNKSKLDKRNSAIDIIRIVAVLCVLSVHFFLHNGFYYETVIGPEMYIMSLMRTLFSICVPLFLLLTGYLMCNKVLSKQYYKGIRKTLIVFVIATIACMIYKAIHNGEIYTFKDFIFDTLDFTGANYSWYIEMYIGLFLIAPFLNLAYNNLGSQKKKQVLVFTFVAITILPTLFNIFNFSDLQWWADPKLSDEFAKILPSWWIGFFPVTYYFTGCYLREYGMKIKTRTLIITLLFCVFIFGSFNFYRSYGTAFKSGIYVYWYGFEPYVMSTLMFVLLSRIKTDKMSASTRITLWKISDLALGIYLISYIFDELVYNVLNTNITPMYDRLPFYFITVPVVFILSAAASAIMNLLANGIIILYGKIAEFVKLQKAKDRAKFWQDILFICLFAAAVIFAFWKCFYGFGGNDEAFYLTIPHRISMGDAFIKDEWHLSQLSGFLLLPFVTLFRAIMGSTDGIILAARLFYVIVHAFVAALIYSKIRKYGVITVFASILFFIFTPFDIMAYSYNTMGLDLIAVTGILMGTADYKKKLPLIISGLTFAGAVLCCPYLAAAYILFGICVAVHYIIKNKNINISLKSELFSIKTFLLFTAGAAILAVIFLVYVLSRVSISEIIYNLPYLMQDPDHPNLPIGQRILYYFNSIYNFNPNFKFAVWGFFAMLVIMAIDKKRKLHRSLYLIISAGFTIYSYVLIAPQMLSYTFNNIVFPIIFVGITSYILCEKKPKNLFMSLFVLGIIYSVAISFSSNQYFYVISMAWGASNIASFVFLAVLLKEMKESEDNFDYALLLKRSSFAIIALAIAIQGYMQISIKAQHCFWESSIPYMTSQIQVGPAKGIYTSQYNCDEYESIYYDIAQYGGNQTPDNVLCLTNRTWCYLALNDYPYGTLSAWITGENSNSLQRLHTYYSVNPEKKPKYIYIPKASEWDFTNIYSEAENSGYRVNENGISYKLEKK